MIWFVDYGIPEAVNIADKISGDFAVRRISSLRSLGCLLAIEETIRIPDLILVFAGAHFNDLETLANVHRAVSCRRHSMLCFFGNCPDSLAKFALEYKIPCIDLRIHDGLTLKSQILRILEIVTSVRAEEAVTQPLGRGEIAIGDISFHAPSGGMKIQGARSLQLLSPKEAKILEVLIAKANQVVSRDEITESAWCDVRVSERTIDSHMSRLRRRIDESFECRIEAVYGQGYILKVGI